MLTKVTEIMQCCKHRLWTFALLVGFAAATSSSSDESCKPLVERKLLNKTYTKRLRDRLKLPKEIAKHLPKSDSEPYGRLSLEMQQKMHRRRKRVRRRLPTGHPPKSHPQSPESNSLPPAPFSGGFGGPSQQERIEFPNDPKPVNVPSTLTKSQRDQQKELDALFDLADTPDTPREELTFSKTGSIRSLKDPVEKPAPEETPMFDKINRKIEAGRPRSKGYGEPIELEPSMTYRSGNIGSAREERYLQSDEEYYDGREERAPLLPKQQKNQFFNLPPKNGSRQRYVRPDAPFQKVDSDSIDPSKEFYQARKNNESTHAERIKAKHQKYANKRDKYGLSKTERGDIHEEMDFPNLYQAISDNSGMRKYWRQRKRSAIKGCRIAIGLQREATENGLGNENEWKKTFESKMKDLKYAVKRLEEYKSKDYKLKGLKTYKNLSELEQKIRRNREILKLIDENVAEKMAEYEGYLVREQKDANSADVKKTWDRIDSELESSDDDTNDSIEMLGNSTPMKWFTGSLGLAGILAGWGAVDGINEAPDVSNGHTCFIVMTICLTLFIAICLHQNRGSSFVGGGLGAARFVLPLMATVSGVGIGILGTGMNNIQNAIGGTEILHTGALLAMGAGFPLLFYMIMHKCSTMSSQQGFFANMVKNNLTTSVLTFTVLPTLMIGGIYSAATMQSGALLGVAISLLLAFMTAGSCLGQQDGAVSTKRMLALAGGLSIAALGFGATVVATSAGAHWNMFLGSGMGVFLGWAVLLLVMYGGCQQSNGTARFQLATVIPIAAAGVGLVGATSTILSSINSGEVIGDVFTRDAIGGQIVPFVGVAVLSVVYLMYTRCGRNNPTLCFGNCGKK